jgi:serine phosphatase RsbU (regulator of sigma subunit)
MTDSELQTFVKGKSSVRRAALYDSISASFLNNDPSYSLSCSNKAIEILEDEDAGITLAKALSNRAKAYRNLSEYDKAITDLDRAYAIFLKANDKSWITSIHLDYGNLFYMSGSYEKAAESYIKALKLSEEQKDPNTQALCENNIGNIYLIQQKFDQAVQRYQNGYKFYKLSGDTARAALTLDNIGIAYINMGQFDMAMLYQVSALQTLESIKDPKKKDLKSQAEMTMNLGVTNLEMKKYDQALKYFDKAYKTYEKVGSKWGLAGCLVNIGETYRRQKKYPEAIEALSKSLAIADTTGGLAAARDAVSNLSVLYEDIGDNKKALEYYKKYTMYKDSLLSEESSNQINELSARYEAEKKEKEIELLTKDKDLSDVKFKSFAAGFALILILLALLGYRFKEKQKANTLLKEKNISINEQKELITIKNKEITDSINYAKRIQDAMLPSRKILNEYFRDNFVFYQPKDIISGDFYWATRKNDQLFIAAADCTGHGVPGALMSMIGISFLRQIINEMNITEPAQVLNKLHEMVVNALNEDVTVRDSKDGMDIAILRVDISKKKAVFAGAVRPLYVANKNGFSVIKGDRFSIGGVKEMTETFVQTDIDLSTATSFYLFSDGFPDQFGEQTEKKFMVKNFQKFLSEIYLLPMDKQQELTSQLFSSWKGKLEQTDDVMVIGLKV